MPFTYEGVINNLNICNVLTLEETISAFYTKKTELKDLVIIKVKSAYFAAQRGFCRGQRGQGRLGACTISQTTHGGYVAQGYFLHLIINHYHSKKVGYR